MQGCPGLRRGRGVDQVTHGLGLDQIHFTVEHRAPGELPRVRGAGTGGLEGRQQACRHHESPVAHQLDGVLAGMTPGAVIGDVDAAVDLRAVRLGELSQDGRSRGIWQEIVDHPGGHYEGVVATEPYHRQG